MVLTDLENVLNASPWKDHPRQVIQLEEFDQVILSFKVEGSIAFKAWQWLRTRVDTLQYWPVITTAWTSESTWHTSIKEEFRRWPFTQEPHRQAEDSLTPAALIERSQKISLEQFWQRLCHESDEELAEAPVYSLADTQAIYGSAPDQTMINEARTLGLICDRLSLEKWLYSWEENHHPHRQLTATDFSYMEWFDPSPQAVVIVLLPITSGAESLAYLHWYAAETVGSEALIAVLKDWEQAYGAELVAHFGTMLQFVVSRPPQTLDQAFALAAQQYAVAPCTLALPGVSLREHVRALMHTDKWFLHERP